MLLKLEPGPTTEKIVEALHVNMLPELKQLVRREDCRSVNELIKRAIKAELALEREAGDRTPIHTSSWVMSEAAYQPAADSGRKPRVKVTPTPTIAALKHKGAPAAKNAPRESKEKKKEMDVLQELTRAVHSLSKQLQETKVQSAR